MSSGIYGIFCTDGVYIGQSVHIESRWLDHRAALASGKHSSVALQRAFNKCGLRGLEWRIIELCSKSAIELQAAEQFHMDRNIERLLNHQKEANLRSNTNRASGLQSYLSEPVTADPWHAIRLQKANAAIKPRWQRI